MKRIAALALAVILTLGMTACGGSEAQNTAAITEQTTAATTVPVEESLQVGYARYDITPIESVPLAGYGNTSSRMSTGASDPIYATCVAITDAHGETVLLYGLDLTNSYSNVIPECRQELAEMFDIPVGNIMISASHMHSGPDLSNTGKESIKRYSALLGDMLQYAAMDALADRKPAQMYIATVQTEGLNFVRRYVLENGTYAGDNYGDFDSSPIAGHESEPDRSLQLLKFVREGGSTVLMANFQTHPHRGGGSSNYIITADIVGAFREEVEDVLGYQVVYFTGASGNINPTSRISEENITKSVKEQGRALAAYAIAAEDRYTPLESGPVRTAQMTYAGKVNHSQDDLLEIAQEIRSVWTSTGNKSLCIEMGKPHGINSPYHAGAIVTKAAMGETWEFDIYAVSVGEVGFAVAPYEMYDTNGVQIKESSPFAMTFVLTCANDSKSYIPSQLGFDHGGYEVDQCRLVAGSGEELAGLYVQMLKTLYSGQD